MPEKDEGKVEITPIGDGMLSLKGVIECPKCKAKILSEIEFEMNMADVMKGEEELPDKTIEAPEFDLRTEGGGRQSRLKPERMDHMDKGAKFENPFKRRTKK